MGGRHHLKVDVCEEPEFQCKVSSELACKIEKWILKRGGVPKKTQCDHATYWDGDNLDLFNEGIEYRTKEKGNKFKHDMKTPLDTHDRVALRDENNILWRNELKLKTRDEHPSLSVFSDVAALAPVLKRKPRLLGVELGEKFCASFSKTKIDFETSDASIEYSFQRGHIQTVDGKRKTKKMNILELELRDGDADGLCDEINEVWDTFHKEGLVLLPKRKVEMGFDLIIPDMSAKQLKIYEEICARGTRAVSQAPAGTLRPAA